MKRIATYSRQLWLRIPLFLFVLISLASLVFMYGMKTTTWIPKETVQATAYWHANAFPEGTKLHMALEYRHFPNGETMVYTISVPKSVYSTERFGLRDTRTLFGRVYMQWPETRATEEEMAELARSHGTPLDGMVYLTLAVCGAVGAALCFYPYGKRRKKQK